MQVFETFLSKKWQTVMWHRECEQSIHVQQPPIASPRWHSKQRKKTVEEKCKLK